MNLVIETYHEYEDKKHEYIQKTQALLLKQKINPYIWFDEKLRLHIQVKHQRNNIIKDLDKKIQTFAEKQNLYIIGKQEIILTDYKLPENIQNQKVTEYILQVC